MTGFGKSEVALPTKKITVEVRSLNSKQLDLSVKLPGIYRSMEFDIRSRAAAAIVRGKADISVSIETTAVQTSATVNKELFKAYLQQINDAMSFSAIGADYDAILPVVMRMPDVVSTQAETITTEEQAALFEAVDEALARFTAFREQEGATLIADLLHRVDRIEEYKAQVEPFEKARTEVIKNRIREHIEKMNLELDNNRLEQEMIFYIEKLDITEE